MKFLVAFSNFKGALTNEEACQIVCQELHDLGHTANAFPIGDGGKGTFAYLKKSPSAQIKTHSITGAFGDPRTAASYWTLSPSGKPQVYLESTEAIGYPPRDPERRDPLGATSKGLGEWLLLIEKDLKGQACELFIGLGDSAISDAGQGMLETLKDKVFSDWKVTVLCDVENPLCGEKGAARVFSPQKGASNEQLLLIEKRHFEFAARIKKQFGLLVDSMPRGGSAGGLATALHVYLRGELVSGSDFVLNASRFEEILSRHDCLIVGEGKTDSQTLQGKSPWVAVQRAEKLAKPSLLISGSLGHGIEKLVSKRLIAKTACGRDPDPKTALQRTLHSSLLKMSSDALT